MMLHGKFRGHKSFSCSWRWSSHREAFEKIRNTCNFFEGTRITDSETLDVVEMVLAGNVNKEVVELINQSGGKAVGLTCQDGNLIKARKKKQKELRIMFLSILDWLEMLIVLIQIYCLHL